MSLKLALALRWKSPAFISHRRRSRWLRGLSLKCLKLAEALAARSGRELAAAQAADPVEAPAGDKSGITAGPGAAHTR